MIIFFMAGFLLLSRWRHSLRRRLPGARPGWVLNPRQPWQCLGRRERYGPWQLWPGRRLRWHALPRRHWGTFLIDIVPTLFW